MSVLHTIHSAYDDDETYSQVFVCSDDRTDPDRPKTRHGAGTPGHTEGNRTE